MRDSNPLNRPLESSSRGHSIATTLAFAGLLGLVAGCGSPPARNQLRIAVFSDPLSLDPHRHNEHNTLSILGNLYEGLVAFDPELRIRPALAESWENPTEDSWVFHLRPGVLFHDGKPLTADDVVYSINRVRFHPESKLSPYLVAVREVRTLDPATVVITTTRPFALLLNKLCFVLIVPRGAAEEIRHPIGTGPYRFVRFEPGRLELEEFPDYWEGAPEFRRATFVTEARAEDRLRRLRNGEVDLATRLGPAEARKLEADESFDLLARESLVVEYLQGRVDQPPFDDLRVRQAMNLALDREALVREVLHGYGEPAYQLVGRNVFGFSPDLPRAVRDLAEARRLLAEAGHPEGLDVVLDSRKDRPGHAAIARQLGEAGIRVELRSAPWEELYPRLGAGQIPFYFGGFLAISADASDAFDSKIHSWSEAGGYGDTNSSGFADPELDRLIESASSVLDMNERRAVLQQCMRRAMEDLPIIPVFSAHNLYGIRGDLEWSPRLDGRILAAEIHPR